MKEKLSLAAAVVAASLGYSEGCTAAHLSPKTQSERREQIAIVLKSLGAVDTGKQPDGGEVECILYKQGPFEYEMDAQIRETELCADAKLKMIEKTCSSVIRAGDGNTVSETKGSVYGARCRMDKINYDDGMGLACAKVSKPDHIDCQ